MVPRTTSHGLAATVVPILPIEHWLCAHGYQRVGGTYTFMTTACVSNVTVQTAPQSSVVEQTCSTAKAPSRSKDCCCVY